MLARTVAKACAQRTVAATAAPAAVVGAQRCNMSTKAKKRPVSPSVTIYKIRTPALSSITHRVTGTALSVGVVGMSMVALTGDCNIPAYWDSLKVAAPALVPVTKLLVGFPLVYHTVAGFRHIAWDATAKGLDLDSVELTSKAVVSGGVCGYEASEILSV